MINTTDLGLLIESAIKAKISELIEEEAKATSVRLQQRVRELIPSIAGRVLERFSMEQMGRELIIKIDVSELSK